jgi:transposase-like protein
MTVEFPDTMQEFIDRFSTEEACIAYLTELRWDNSFRCTNCNHEKAWRHAKGILRCQKCHKDISVTAGTVFEKTHLPLRTWFLAVWSMISQKHGISALGVARILGLKRYETAWSLLHRIRSAMVRKGREKLTGVVEVDEVFLGGVKPGKRGRGAAGKVLVLVAVEDKGKAGFGRIRIQIIRDAEARTLLTAIQSMVESGSTVRTDKFKSYPIVIKHGYQHQAIDRESAVGEDPTPLVHRVASLLKRWLLGTHHGRVEAEQVNDYLQEFVFRFNRRTSRSCGKLFYRLMQQLVASQRQKGR